MTACGVSWSIVALVLALLVIGLGVFAYFGGEAELEILPPDGGESRR